MTWADPASWSAARRPDWDVYFGMVARVIAARGKCLRVQVGCVLVADRRIVATGYNGPPPGERSCVDGPEYCPCGLDSGSARLGTATVSRDLCPALHAEQNAVAQAGQAAAGGTAYITRAPCSMCARQLRAAGIERVVLVGDLGVQEWRPGLGVPHPADRPPPYPIPKY